MKLKNEALEKLYDRLVDGPISLSVYAGVLEKPFEEVDRELTNLQNRNDILEKSNGTLLDANLDLCTKNRDLKDRNNQLQKEIKQLKLDLDALLNRAHCAEDEAEDLKNKCSVREERIKELIDRLEKVSSDRDELQKDRDIWFRKNGEKLAEIAELKKQLDGALEAEKAVNDSRYKWAQKWLSTKQNLEAKLNEAEVKYRRLEKEHEELTIENKRLRNSVRSGYDQGQTDLWVKLQNVKDMQPNEFDMECECLGDVIDMDLEDFLDSYKKWWEQKEIDRMRKWLDDFCYGRVCEECPLGSHEYKCGCGYSFKKRDRFDLRIIPDEDIKRYYETAHGCGRYTLNDGKLIALPNMEGVNRAIAKACENFCEAVRDTDIKIKENICRNNWECTFTANIEVNKDLLEKVCGVKSEEEEHKLEYGDAVRLPWRDRDYMYIGPSKANPKHIRLFDPENRHVVVVSSTDNLTYNHGGILVANEDDLRKIWKDKE